MRLPRHAAVTALLVILLGLLLVIAECALFYLVLGVKH
jgi:hypothetical protein